MAEVDISCLCGKVRTTVLLTDTIPIRSSLCHRSQCRYNLGSLYHSALPIQAPPEESVLDGLSCYEPQSDLQRYFCPVCGSHLFQHDTSWRVQSGVVEGIHNEQVFDKLEEIVEHASVHETVDGGLSASLTGSKAQIEGDLLQPPESGSTLQDRRCPALATVDFGGHEDHSRLQARCHCGGVEFFLTRPDAASSECSSPWPDLIVPWYKHSEENAEDVKWWIEDGQKWLAGICTCRSCRIGLGCPVQAWTFVSMSNLSKPDGTKFSYDLGTLRSFESSPGACREFCNRCGATVFWHNSQRPGVVDVSVGLLRASEGALARSWLKWWTQRVSYAEHALDKQLVSLLQSNLHELDQDLLPE